MKKAGLTLIEVLVALVILSIGASSLMLAMAKNLSVVRTIRHRENARNLMVRLEVEHPLPVAEELQEGVESGRFDNMPQYSWEREILLIDEELCPGLYQVRSRIWWSERGKNAFEEVRKYLYEPDPEKAP